MFPRIRTGRSRSVHVSPGIAASQYGRRASQWRPSKLEGFRSIRRKRLFRLGLTSLAVTLAGTGALFAAAGDAFINSPSPIPVTAISVAPMGSAPVSGLSLSWTSTNAQPTGAAAGAGQATWYISNTAIDLDGDDISETLYLVVGDTGSGTIDTADISLDNDTFSEGNLTDGVLGAGNDERVTGDALLMIGSITITFNFPSSVPSFSQFPFTLDLANHALNPPVGNSVVRVTGPTPSELLTIGGVQYNADGDNTTLMCNPSPDGGWVSNGGTNVPNCVGGPFPFGSLVVCGLAAIGSPNVYDCYLVGTGQVTFPVFNSAQWFAVINGAGTLTEPTGGSWGIQYGYPEGNGPDDDGGLTSSTWYVGTISANVGGVDQNLQFVFTDTDSDGAYETLQIDANNNGLYDPDETFANGDQLVLDGRPFALSFGPNPATSDFIMVRQPIPPEYPDHQGESVTSGNPGIAALKNGEPPTQGEIQAMANMSVPGRPKPPSLADAIRTIDGQPLVANEIIVSVDLEHKDPDVLAKRIALAFGGEITGAIPKARTYQVLVKADTAEVLDQISDDVAGVPGIEAAEAHWMVDKFGARTPNDSFFGKPLPDKPYVAQWDMAFLNLPQVWDITTGSPSVPVAVIDADFDPAHSDLKVNVRKAFGDRSAAGGHGTHVAATACGAGDNGGGIAGVAWQCNLRIYDFGASSALMAQEAMIEAIDDGARIVNISAQWVDNNQCGKMGSPAIKKRAEQMNATFAPAINYAQKQKKDVLWVLAAGNECRDTVYASPASLVKQFPDNVIVVASVDPDGRLSHFSNFGDLVDVAAPGGEILSAVPRKCNPDCKDSFELQSGTSMAAPHVTGVAALMRSVNPGINAKKLKQCLLASASRPVGGQPFGIIDALSAVRCADG